MALTSAQRAAAKAQAARFRIWQIGRNLNWNCDADYIADRVRLSPRTVKEICIRKGWPIEGINPVGRPRNEDRAAAVDEYRGWGDVAHD